MSLKRSDRSETRLRMTDTGFRPLPFIGGEKTITDGKGRPVAELCESLTIIQRITIGDVFAAAPELLSACYDALDRLRSLESQGRISAPITIETLEKAIAKAEGRSE